MLEVLAVSASMLIQDKSMSFLHVNSPRIKKKSGVKKRNKNWPKIVYASLVQLGIYCFSSYLKETQIKKKRVKKGRQNGRIKFSTPL